VEAKYIVWEAEGRELGPRIEVLEASLFTQKHFDLATTDLGLLRSKIEQLRLWKSHLALLKLKLRSAVTFIETVREVQAVIAQSQHQPQPLPFSQIRSRMKSLWLLSLDLFQTPRERREELSEICLRVREIKNPTRTDTQRMDFDKICFNY
jgi:hypothetical protein